MKAITPLFFVLFLFISCFSYSQVNEDAQKKLPSYAQYSKMPKYQTWVKLNNKKRKKGYLYRVSNDEISLLPYKLSDYVNFRKFEQEQQSVIKILDVKKIRTRKKGKLKKGILIGSGIGLGLGVLWGSVQPDDMFAVETVPFTIVTTIVGGLIGAAISGKKVKHDLNEKAELEGLKKKGIGFAF